MLHPMFLMWLLACRSPSCEAEAGAARAACLDAACGKGSGLDYETCLAEQIPPLNDVADVRRVAARMADDVLRDTAVLNWAETPDRLITQPEARSLCELLLNTGDREKCVRDLTTPHLQR